MLKLLETCYHHNGIDNGLEESNQLSILAMAMLVLFLVSGISYAAYLFVDAMHISDASGVHITKNLSLAISDLRGNLYSNTEKGIKDWLVFKDVDNNFEIRYPNNFEYKNEDGNLFSARFSNKQSDKKDSIAMVVNVGKLIQKNESDFVKVVADNEKELDARQFNQEQSKGRALIHTKKHREESGLDGDTYYWQMDGEVIYLQAHYYNADSASLEELFSKIVEEFKITQEFTRLNNFKFS